MKKVYRYYTRFRPPMPGAIPREGLVLVHGYDDRQLVDGVSAWGYVEYDRPLTEKEVRDYELAAASKNPLESDGGL